MDHWPLWMRKLSAARLQRENPRGVCCGRCGIPWTHVIRRAEDALADDILDAYARYDSDPRVNGPDDFEAFRDAIRPLIA